MNWVKILTITFLKNTHLKIKPLYTIIIYQTQAGIKLFSQTNKTLL